MMLVVVPGIMPMSKIENTTKERIRFLCLSLLGLFLILLLACSAEAGTEQIGTVELSLDGVEQTWYVVQPGGEMRPNAAWVRKGPDKGALSVVAYPDPNVEFEAA